LQTNGTSIIHWVSSVESKIHEKTVFLQCQNVGSNHAYTAENRQKKYEKSGWDRPIKNGKGSISFAGGKAPVRAIVASRLRYAKK